MTATVRVPGPIVGLAFDASGRRVVSSSTDGVVRVWPLDMSPLHGPTDKIFSVSFDREGTRMGVFPGSSDGTVELWELDEPNAPRPIDTSIALPDGSPGLSGSGALSPDGRFLASGTVDGQLAWWTVEGTTITAQAPLPGATALIELVAAGPPGVFAGAADDGSVPIWDVSDLSKPSLRTRLLGPTELMLGVSFNADATLLAAANADRSVYLRDVKNLDSPRLLATLDGFENYAYSVAFSDDGTLLVAGSADNTVRVWDIQDPANPVAVGKPLIGPQNYVYSVAFRPGTRLLAAASTDSTLWLWDLTEPERPVRVTTLNLSDAALFVAAFQPNSTILAGAGSDHLIYRWNIDSTTAFADVCKSVGDPLTTREWERYVRDLPYDDPCAGLE